jgi:hypothetical protein
MVQALVLLQNGSDFEEEVGLQERFVYAAVRPRAEQPSVVTVAKPILPLSFFALQNKLGKGFIPAFP